MSMLDEIGTYLVAEGHGTLASTLWQSFLPDDPAAAVAIYELPGMPPALTQGDTNLPAFEKPQLQVVCRAASYPSARTKAGNIWRSLNKIGNEALSGTQYLAIVPLDSPSPLGRDHLQRELVVSHYEVWRVPPATE